MFPAQAHKPNFLFYVFLSGFVLSYLYIWIMRAFYFVAICKAKLKINSFFWHKSRYLIFCGHQGVDDGEWRSKSHDDYSAANDSYFAAVEGGIGVWLVLVANLLLRMKAKVRSREVACGDDGKVNLTAAVLEQWVGSSSSRILGLVVLIHGSVY